MGGVEKLLVHKDGTKIQLVQGNGADKWSYFFTDNSKWRKSRNWRDLIYRIKLSDYIADFTSDKPNHCPIDHFILVEQDGRPIGTTETRITMDDGIANVNDPAKKYEIQVNLQGGTDYKKNYFNAVKIRGYTSARFNTQANRLVPNLYVEKWLYIDVCGWESITTPARVRSYDQPIEIPLKTEYFIEAGDKRTKLFTFWPYTTDSAPFPTWHPAAGKTQCDVTRYELVVGPGGTNDTPYLPQLNTIVDDSTYPSYSWLPTKTYHKSLRSWDESKRSFLIDTADRTAKLTTETFYVKVTSRGNRSAYYPVESTLLCGRETLA